MPDVIYSQQLKPHNTVRTSCVGRAGHCLTKGRDTVGEPPSAEIRVTHMPSLKAKKAGKLPREKVLLELWNTFADSIREVFETRLKV
jgi:hypothetical protein